ncbi:MAG: hypothetical protein P8Z81_14185 [Deinococcales bacterium]|jgi:hypothetical protein
MHVGDRVWLHDKDGTHVTSTVPPAAWNGKAGCVIGPFSCAENARTYLRLHRTPAASARVFPSGPAYFVAVNA